MTATRKFISFVIASACPGEDRKGRRGYLLVSKKGTQYQVKTKPSKRLDENAIVKIYKNDQNVLQWCDADIQSAIKLSCKTDAHNLGILWAAN